MSPDTLVLRDIHQPAAPGWWPPAPGWWMLAAILLIAVAVACWFVVRLKRRQRAIVALFDDAVAQAPTASAGVAAMSELLRRAARRHDPAADRLYGDAWLRFLDGDDARQVFSSGAGRLLLDGGYRRDIDAQQLAEVLPLARRRYLQLMAVRR
nr:DUF4381 domain-containing protein [Luteimonas cucumeris]